jgi:Phage tail sheath C-terminal domain
MARAPFIRFTNVDVGFTTPRPNVQNRVCIVGQFSRGPANEVSFIGGISDFQNRFGSDTAPGSLFYQAAYEQYSDPSSFNAAAVRVLGASRPAATALLFSNVASQNLLFTLHTRYASNAILREEYDSSIVTESNFVPWSISVNSVGEYTGTVSGRIFFRVTSIADGSATVKYQFVPLGGVQALWSSVNTSINVILADNAASNLFLVDGVQLRFGTVPNTPLTMAVGNEGYIRVNASEVTIEVNAGDLPNQVVNKIIEEATDVEPFGSIERNSTDNGVVITLDDRLVPGTEGNRYYLFTTLSETEPVDGFSVSPNPGDDDYIAFTGGLDGPRQAYRDFYSLNDPNPIFRVQAVSEGSWGNGLSLDLYPLSNSEFRLSITDSRADSFSPSLAAESYIIDLNRSDENGFLTDLAGSKFVRGIFLPKFNNPQAYDIELTRKSPVRLAPAVEGIVNPEDPRNPNFYGPNYLKEVSLEDGFDGPPPTDADYIAVIRKLINSPVHIIGVAGVASEAVNQVLIAECERATERDGLRIALLSSMTNLTPNLASRASRGYDSTRAVMVGGWVTYAGQANAPRYAVPATAFYAGKLSNIPHYVSPAARGLVGPVFGVLETDMDSTINASSLDIYSEERIEVLALDKFTGTYSFSSGVTLSADPAWERIYLRRSHDVVQVGLEQLLRSFLAQPNSRDLRSRIGAGINAYLSNLRQRGEILDFRPPTIDASNNTPTSYLNRELRIDVSFLPLYSADYITVSVARDINSPSSVISS